MKKKIKERGLPRVASLLRVLALMGVVMTAATSYAQGQDPCKIQINGGSVTAISTQTQCNAVGGGALTVSTKSYMTVKAGADKENAVVIQIQDPSDITSQLESKAYANFEYTKYPVTVTNETPNWGNVSITGDGDGKGNYTYGSEVTLTAIPKDSYSFNSWYKETEPVSTDPVLKYTVEEGGASFKAVFSDKVCITVSATECGSITSITSSKDPGEDYKPESTTFGSTVKITAKGSNECAFKGWFNTETNEKVCTDLTYEFEAKSNVSLEARFTDQVIWVRVKKGN